MILVGAKFWGGLVNWMETELLRRRYISPGDTKLVKLTDDPQEAVGLILEYQRTVGVTPIVSSVVA
jgi:hypothetical protein